MISEDGDAAHAQNPSYLGHSGATQRSQVEVEKELSAVAKSRQHSQMWGQQQQQHMVVGGFPFILDGDDWQQVECTTGWDDASWLQNWSSAGSSANKWTQQGVSRQPPRDSPSEVVDVKYWGSGAQLS